MDRPCGAFRDDGGPAGHLPFSLVTVRFAHYTSAALLFSFFFRMRSLLYWLCASLVAVVAAHAADFRRSYVEASFVGPLLPGQEPLVAMAPYTPAPDPARSILLGVGVMAMAYTYRRAWLNLRPQPAAPGRVE